MSDATDFETRYFRVRNALIWAGRAAGAQLADDVSDDFLMHVPEEVAAVRTQRDEAHHLNQIWSQHDHKPDLMTDNIRLRELNEKLIGLLGESYQIHGTVVVELGENQEYYGIPDDSPIMRCRDEASEMMGRIHHQLFKTS